MEQAITSRYNENILQAAMQRFGILPEHITLLDGFESYIYEFTRESNEYILRISHSLRRTHEMIQGEAEWINYLANGGAGVARAVASPNGNLVETLDDGHGGQFLATAFVKASGRHTRGSDWSPELYKRYGQLLGRIHALSKDYTPSSPAIQRKDWNAPESLDVVNWLPKDEPIVRKKWDAVLAHLAALPRDSTSYGMIHQDAHAGNFFITEDGQLTLFDFDDCVYGWYVYDIAMVIFYMISHHPNPTDLMERFWPHFWAGYQSEYALDPVWLKEIPWFLRLREIDLYALHFRSFEDVHNMDDPWSAQFMNGRRERIEGDVPMLVFDFG